jgi:hypothetical protein
MRTSLIEHEVTAFERQQLRTSHAVPDHAP